MRGVDNESLDLEEAHVACCADELVENLRRWTATALARQRRLPQSKADDGALDTAAASDVAAVEDVGDAAQEVGEADAHDHRMQ